MSLHEMVWGAIDLTIIVLCACFITIIVYSTVSTIRKKRD